MWWIYFVIPCGELLHRRRTRSFGWGYGHIPLFGAIVAIGAGLHVAAFYLERRTQLGAFGDAAHDGDPGRASTSWRSTCSTACSPASIDPLPPAADRGTAVLARAVALAAAGAPLGVVPAGAGAGALGRPSSATRPSGTATTSRCSPGWRTRRAPAARSPRGCTETPSRPSQAAIGASSARSASRGGGRAPAARRGRTARAAAAAWRSALRSTRATSRSPSRNGST